MVNCARMGTELIITRVPSPRICQGTKVIRLARKRIVSRLKCPPSFLSFLLPYPTLHIPLCFELYCTGVDMFAHGISDVNSAFLINSHIMLGLIDVWWTGNRLIGWWAGCKPCMLMCMGKMNTYDCQVNCVLMRVNMIYNILLMGRLTARMGKL